MKSAFVTAAGVLEVSVCKYLYILICFQPQMFLCVCIPHPWPLMQASLPTCTASGRYQPVTQLICMVQLHLAPSPHSEGLASKENQISLVSIQPGKRVAKGSRALLQAELSAGGGWQGVLGVLPSPTTAPAALRAPW